MKTCSESSCGTQMPDDAAFCPECGAGQPSATGAIAGVQQTVGMMGTVGPKGTFDPNFAGDEVALEAGTVFADRYEIEGPIGQGGMGVVYRAQDTITKKTVALKLVSPRLLGSESAVERLIAEGATAQDIRHDNIVAVYDVGRADDQVYISMEYVGGSSLRDWISERMASPDDVPLRVAARIIAEILDGLKVAHARGVIHRDLKPENIILAQAPDDKYAPLKILDFGIARSAGTTMAGASSSGALGTFDYMAPEQRTNADSAGPAADLYSVSKIFYELLVGVLPVGHWQPPSGGRTDVPVGIDQLIEQGLSNRPQNRPQSAADYRQALVAAVNNQRHFASSPAPQPKPQPHQPRPPKPPSSGGIPKWAIWAGAGVGGFLLLAVLASAMGGGGGTSSQGASSGSSRTLSNLSGSWYDGPVGYNIRVSNNGQLSGTGRAPNGETLSIEGYLPATGYGEYALLGNNGTATEGTIRWDGNCHVNYEFTNLYTGANGAGQFHIDHPPSSQGCPPRFR